MQVARKVTWHLAPLLSACALAGAGPTVTHAGSPDTGHYSLHELVEPAAPGRNRADIEGSPDVVLAAPGRVVAFDGATDRLVLNENPLAGAEEFTVEVLLRPRDAFRSSPEPRFLHIESATNPERRLTMELRLDEQHRWYLDAFIKADGERLTLIDPARVHPVGRWYHAAVTYRDGRFSTYVNGVKELEGTVRYRPIPADARTSIGARLNRLYWFAGEIAFVRVTQGALEPGQFTGLDLLPD